MTLLGTMALVGGTLPLSAAYLRHARQDAPLILCLYCLIAAGLLARLASPSIEWRPDTASLFGVQSVELPTIRHRFAGSLRGSRIAAAPRPRPLSDRNEVDRYWPYQKKPL